MRRTWLVLLLLTLGAAANAGAAAGAAQNPLHRDDGRPHRPLYFAVACAFSHRNTDDPIVYPGQSGRSHDHTFFGNTTTNASSTPGSLRGEPTTCRLPEDTAAYWAPTLFVGDQPIEPTRATVYYVRRTLEPVEPFPAGLKIIAGDARATSAQSQRVTFWSCGVYGRVAPSSSVPACAGGRRSALHLQVNFPNCWDGSRLDSANHKSHMTYSVSGSCPESHPVEVPAISLIIRYPVAGGQDAELSSGGQFSGHADFVNAWDQDALEFLVDRYLNRVRS